MNICTNMKTRLGSFYPSIPILCDDSTLKPCIIDDQTIDQLMILVYKLQFNINIKLKSS